VSVPLLTAIGDPRREADLVASLGTNGHGVHVVRRCVDVTDLVAAASAGLARAALLSADLRRLDGDALTRLAVAGVAVVGLVPPGDDPAEQRLRRLGVGQVLPVDAPVSVIAQAVLSAVTAGTAAPVHALAGPASILPPAPRSADDDRPDLASRDGNGTVVAVWGPTGAPGRSSVAIGVASELAEAGVDTLLVDADVYGGVVAQLLGLLDESPGVAGACRLANNGTLDVTGLAELAVQVRPRLRVLTGISRAERWPELRPSALDAVLGLARSLAMVTVVDCGFGLERDEELSFDTAAPRRNGATLTVLESADTVLGVASGDPIGLHRYVRALSDLAEAVPTATAVTVVNRVRAAAVGGGDAQAEIRAALDRFAGVRDAWFVPLDVPSYDAAVASGRTLLEVAKSSPARRALQSLAASLAGVEPPRRQRRRRRSRRRGSSVTSLPS
jgi:MinD-like ATPase involved in chromosome partitioning or flagellar assembly